MTITSSGVFCDFCGDLLWSAEDTFGYVKLHGVSGGERLVYGSNCCEQQLRVAAEAGDWKLLPDGPVKKAYQEANKEKIDE